MFAKVELEPFTPRGSLSRFEANPPPERVDSAARESEATAPAPSLMTGAFESVTWMEFVLVFCFLGICCVEVRCWIYQL